MTPAERGWLPVSGAETVGESAPERRRRAEEILRRLRDEYPESRLALDFGSPLELLVATVLAAQCTDARVNAVTPALFGRCPDARAYAEIPLPELEELVRSTGFYRNKARALQGLGRALAEDHSGEVPATMEELTALPGVGRKTANVVLGNAFGREVGIVVDTHVKRLSRRLALSASEDAGALEQDLLGVVPKGAWNLWSLLLMDHGRAVCQARKPACGACVVADLCPSRT